MCDAEVPYLRLQAARECTSEGEMLYRQLVQVVQELRSENAQLRHAVAGKPARAFVAEDFLVNRALIGEALVQRTMHMHP